MQSPTAHLPRQSVNEASKAGVYVDSLFTQSRLYEVTKPLISLIRKNISDAIARGYGGQINEDNSWSSDRISQFVEHVFSRIRSIFKIDSTDTSNSSMDTQMIERAAAYISALSKEGTNFVGNEYVKHHVIEALMPATVCSLRAISKRLDVNRQLLPKLIEKRRKFDKISMSAMDGPLSPAVAHQPDESLDDSSLAEQEGSFASNLQPDQLGLIHLFSGLGLSAEDDFFYSDNQTALSVDTDEPVHKRIKKVNVYNDHLKVTIRKKRKDCPKYVDVVRAFGHSIFRPDTFARKKVMVSNDEGDFEMHLQHIQSKSMEEAHRSFLQSELYHDWQYENRWIRKVITTGKEVPEEEIVQPSIGLRLFFYAMCPCCKDPTQRDCADSFVASYCTYCTYVPYCLSSLLSQWPLMKRKSISRVLYLIYEQ